MTRFEEGGSKVASDPCCKVCLPLAKYLYRFCDYNVFVNNMNHFCICIWLYNNGMNDLINNNPLTTPPNCINSKVVIPDVVVETKVLVNLQFVFTTTVMVL